MTDLPEDSKIKFSAHALRQMFARSISVDEVGEVVRSGETIAEYKDDKPYPSRLVLGFPAGRPIHVVFAQSPHGGDFIVVTTYQPDDALWESDFTSRRGSP